MFSKHGVHWGSICPPCSRRPKQILRTVSVCGNAEISERYAPTTSICTTTPKKDLRICSNCVIKLYFSWNLDTKINISTWYVQVVQISISYWQNNCRKLTNESWCFLRGHGRAKRRSLKKFFCTRYKNRLPPLLVSLTFGLFIWDFQHLLRPGPMAKECNKVRGYRFLYKFFGVSRYNDI